MALLAVSTVSAAEANWPQFHGPGGGGVAEPSDPPVLFGPDTAVLWKIPFPAGNSSPCIWGDRIFLTAFDHGALETVCVRRGDGSVLWRRAAPATKAESTHRLGSPATPTPTTDGRLVFAYFGSYGLIAYDLDGTERWRLSLRTPVVEFGTSASPVLSDGRLFLVCDQDEGSFLLAVDAATGRTLWRVERPEFRRSFATPFLWRHDGSEELVVPGSIWLKSYRPSDGRELWTYSGTSRVACSSPVAGGGLLFSASWNVGGDADSRVTMEPFDEFVRGIGKDADAVLSRESIPAGPVRERFTQIAGPHQEHHLGTAVARRCQRLAGGRWCSSVKAVGSPCEPCTSTSSEEWAMLAMERLRCWNLRLPPWPARHWRVYRLHGRHTMPVTLYSSWRTLRFCALSHVSPMAPASTGSSLPTWARPSINTGVAVGPGILNAAIFVWPSSCTANIYVSGSRG
jgi:hypothetical protein